MQIPNPESHTASGRSTLRVLIICPSHQNASVAVVTRERETTAHSLSLTIACTKTHAALQDSSGQTAHVFLAVD